MAFMSYTNMSDILKQSFFNTMTRATTTTVISNVVSAILKQTTNTDLTKPFIFTLKHIMPLDPQAILSCMNWETNTWDTCSIIQTNNTHTVCSCQIMTTLAVISQTNPCKFNLTVQCAMEFLEQIQYNIPQDLSKENLQKYLTIIMNLTSNEMKTYNSYGNILMDVTEKFASALVQENKPISISLHTFELQVIAVEPEDFSPNLRLITSHASMDINLIANFNEDKGQVAVAFMSYTDMADILEPTFIKTFTDTKKTIISMVVSATLLKATDTNITEPVSFTLKHIQEFQPKDILSCVYWKTDTWLNDGCSIIQFNITHTECSCDHMATFALILQSDPCSKLRAVLAGIQWYFLMSVFVWMFIEAVLLYNFMKNLSNITSISEQVFSWKWLIVIGYLTPLGVLGMSGVRFPKGYIDEECWFVEDEKLIFIFAGPVVFTFTLNLVPCLSTVIIMIFTLKKLKNEIFHMSSSAEKNLIICLMLRSLTQFIILVCYLIFLYIPSKNGALYHAFQFLNSQQGTFIFLIHCLFNQEVRQKYRNVMCVLCFSDNPVETSRSVRGQAGD
ncbi:uncharacterized protein LOC113636404 isoform X3 [Tachysurus ichikawai]